MTRVRSSQVTCLGGQTRAVRPGKMIMTDDKAHKAVIRARMAQTGEPYMAARRAVEAGEQNPAGRRRAAGHVPGRAVPP